MQPYGTLATFRQPGEVESWGGAIIELRQYGYDVARYVNGIPQEWTSDASYCDARCVIGLLEGWLAFERKIGSELLS